MTDVRFGDIAHPAGGVRFGDIAHQALTARTVLVNGGGAHLPGETITLNLGGTWDAGSKTITWNGVSITPATQNATTMTFVAPDPTANGSAHSLNNFSTAYDLVVDDTGAAVDAVSFELTPPDTDGPTYWYIPAITGGPTWNQSSILYGHTGVDNGDSLFVEVQAGTMTSVATDGSFIAASSIKFRSKAYDAGGWSTSWATTIVADSDAPAPSSAAIDAAGTSLTVVFDDPVLISGTPTIALACTNGAVTATYASGANTATLVFSLDRTVGGNETVTASYTSNGSLTSVVPENVLSFSLYPVTNGASGLAVSFFGSVPNLGATINEAYSYSLSPFFSGVQAAGYSVHAGALPTGLSLNTTTGLISGTPTVSETQTGIVIRGTDGADTADSNSFSIAIQAASALGSTFNDFDNDFGIGGIG